MKLQIRKSYQRSPSGRITGEHWVVSLGDAQCQGEGTTLRDAKMDYRHNAVHQCLVASEESRMAGVAV